VESRKIKHVWSDSASVACCYMYSSGTDLGYIVSELKHRHGIDVTEKAARHHAEKQGHFRPKNYAAILATRQHVGRTKGSKNKKPYVRTKGRVTHNYTDALRIASDESDEVFQWLIQKDMEQEQFNIDMRIGIHKRYVKQRDVAFGLDRAAQREAKAKLLADKAAQREAEAKSREEKERLPDAAKRLSPFADDAVFGRFVPPSVPNVVPTARRDPATKGAPYRMSVMSGPDPLKEAKLRQIMESARGRV